MNMNDHIHDKINYTPAFFIREFIILVVCFSFIFCFKWLRDGIYMWELMKPGYDSESLWHWENILVIPVFLSLRGLFFNYYVITFLGAILGSGVNNNNRSQIDRIANYRNSKLTCMNDEAAAEEYLKTAWMDALNSSEGAQTQRAKDYINSKLTGMSDDTGYKWIKENKGS